MTGASNQATQHAQPPSNLAPSNPLPSNPATQRPSHPATQQPKRVRSGCTLHCTHDRSPTEKSRHDWRARRPPPHPPLLRAKHHPQVLRTGAWRRWHGIILKRRLKELGLSEQGGILRTKANCLRICEGGPIAVVYPEGAWYGECVSARNRADHPGTSHPGAAWSSRSLPIVEWSLDHAPGPGPQESGLV